MYMYLHNTLQIKFIETYLRIQYIGILKAHTVLTIQPVVTVETNASVFMRQFIKCVSLQF